MFFSFAVKVSYFLYCSLLKKNKQGQRGMQAHIGQLPQQCKAILISINTAIPKEKKLGGFSCTRNELRVENAVTRAKKVIMKSAQASCFSNDSR